MPDTLESNLESSKLWLGKLDGYLVLTLASAAGLTFPLTKKAPPRTTIWPTFFAKAGSS